MIVTTTGPDGEEVTYDPEMLVLAIISGKLDRDPDAQQVAGALILAWLQTTAKTEIGERAVELVGELRDEAEHGRQLLLGMDALEFVAFLKAEPDFARSLVGVGQTRDGQRRRGRHRR